MKKYKVLYYSKQYAMTCCIYCNNLKDLQCLLGALQTEYVCCLRVYNQTTNLYCNITNLIPIIKKG